MALQNEMRAMPAASTTSVSSVLSGTCGSVNHGKPAGTGAMAAILGLTDEQVAASCDQAAEGEVVEAVNFNAPGQVVIAGERAAVERAIEVCKAAGAKRAIVQCQVYSFLPKQQYDSWKLIPMTFGLKDML